jgi:hypothetical protein
VKLNSSWIPWILLAITAVGGVWAFSGRITRLESCCEKVIKMEDKQDKTYNLIYNFLTSQGYKPKE